MLKVGTFQIAILAKTFKKPFYVAVESYKFSRLYPLNQKDFHDINFNYEYYNTNNTTSTSNTSSSSSNIKNPINSANNDDKLKTNHMNSFIPKVDFTPSEYITLLFTDLGVLTPAAVSDELIRLYQ